MAHIYVETDRLVTGAAALRQHKATFDETLSTLESDLAPMIETWSGEARELYLGKKKLWDAAAADLSALLKSIADLTTDAHTSYTATVNELIELWT